MSEDNVIFEATGSDEDESGKPVFSSSNAAAWIREDKNGDSYISLVVDMGVLGSHSVNLFVRDSLKPEFNDFASELK
jgi:hypothetical protein